MARENLERWLQNKRIRGARVLDQRMLRGQSARRLEQAITGARLRRVHRRGKYLIWDLGDRGQLVAHLGMSGKFVMRARGEPDPPAARVVLERSEGKRVVFSDRRRLGRFQLVDDDVRELLGRLGVEPLGKEFTPARLRELLSCARTPMKSFLLDQHRVAGLGNIHATEALFRAGIHPTRIARGLTREEISRLRRSIRTALNQTLRRDRSAEVSYLHEASVENRFLIYGREGEPCRRCGALVKRIVQAGRSTFYCPGCQPRARTSRAAHGPGKTGTKSRYQTPVRRYREGVDEDE